MPKWILPSELLARGDNYHPIWAELQVTSKPLMEISYLLKAFIRPNSSSTMIHKQPRNSATIKEGCYFLFLLVYMVLLKCRRPQSKSPLWPALTLSVLFLGPRWGRQRAVHLHLSTWTASTGQGLGVCHRSSSRRGQCTHHCSLS